MGPRLIRRPVREARKSVEQSVRLFPTTNNVYVLCSGPRVSDSGLHRESK